MSASSMTVAVCGKGGVGKTSISAIIAAEMRKRKNIRSLFVDADPASGLCIALGAKPDKTLEGIRQKIVSFAEKKQLPRIDVEAELDSMLFDAVLENGNVGVLSIGRPESEGCYCPVNSLLKKAISELAGSFDFSLIDAEAGIEQVSRKVFKSVDYMLLVVDKSAKSKITANEIAKAAWKLHPEIKCGVFFNRALEAEIEMGDFFEDGIDNLGSAPESNAVEEFDSQMTPFWDFPENNAYRSVVRALDEILDVLTKT